MAQVTSALLVLAACLVWHQAHAGSTVRPQFPRHSGFPYCRCHDYGPDSSPISLEPAVEIAGDTLDPATAVPSVELSTSITTLAPAAVDDAQSACWWQIWIQGLQKIEIKSTPDVCNNDNVAVYVNGNKLSGAVDRKGGFIRIKLGSKTPIQLAGTTIRIVGSGECSTQELVLGGPIFQYAVFNSDPHALICCPTLSGLVDTPSDAPPPNAAREDPPSPDAPSAPAPPFTPGFPGLPPAGEGFPWCKCDRMYTDYAPFEFYILSLLYEIDTGKELVVGLIKINPKYTDPAYCDPSNACCQMGPLQKLEFHINDLCRGSVADVRVYKPSEANCTNPASCEYDLLYKRSPSYQNYGTGKTVFKITNLNLTVADADSVVVTFYLQDKCADFFDFIAPDFTMSLMDLPTECCPVWDVQPYCPICNGAEGDALPPKRGPRVAGGVEKPPKIERKEIKGKITETVLMQEIASIGNGKKKMARMA